MGDCDLIALRAYLNAQSRLPARLGVVDCVTFCVGALLVGWGRDYSRVLRYKDRRSAVTQLREEGGLLQATRAVLGPEDFCYDFPPGSLAYFPTSPTLGLILDGWVLIKGHKQIMRVERCDALKGWRTA